MPSLPNAYSVVLEVNRVKSKESKTVHEYFDFDNQRVRTDVHNNGKIITVIRDWPSKTKYAMINDLSDASFFHQMNLAEDSICVKEVLDESPTKDVFASKTRHMKSPHEVFMFDSKGDEKYVGEDFARGIKCTQWYATSTEDQTVDGHKVTISTTRNHWFSVPNWISGNCAKEGTGSNAKGDCHAEIPVRTVSEGTVLNHTSGTSTAFHDHYEYTAFKSGQPSPHLFTPETEEGGKVKCTKGAKGSTDTTNLQVFDFPRPVNVVEDEQKDKFFLGLFKDGMMPELPTAYTAVLEINRVKQGASMNVFEYFDFNSQRVRTDVTSGGQEASVIRDYNTRSMYTIVDSNVHDDPYTGYNADDQCLKTQLQEEMRFASQTRHLKSPHEVFMFASDGKEKFIGFDFARGIKCTQWYAESIENQVIGGHFMTVYSKRNHWFSAPDWSNPGCLNTSSCELQVPVRIVSEGHMVNESNKRVTKFHDHYEYMAFVEGKPPTYMFAPSMNCGDVTRGSSEQDKDNAEDLAGGAVADAFALVENVLEPNKKKTMPTLPSAYSVVVEMNRVKQEETMTVSQYFDFAGKRVRTDVRDDDKIVTVIRDFANQHKYILTNDLSDVSFFRDMNSKDTIKCVKEPLTASSSDYLGESNEGEITKTLFAADTRHMKSPHEVFMFDSKGDEKYVGEDYARGIKCTQWYAMSRETETIDGHVIRTTSKRNHWFSSPDWSDPGCVEGAGRDCFLELPVRTVSEGTVFNLTTGTMIAFHDHYEYTAFTPGTPDDFVFEPDKDTDLKCTTAAEGATTIPVTMRKTASTASTSVVSRDAPVMPRMPAAYTAILEINKVESKESSIVREYLDFKNQNIRTDVADGGKVVSVIRDFKNALRHEITDPDIYDDPYTGFNADDTCVTTSIPSDYKMYTASHTRHMHSPHEIFMFSPEAKTEYIGIDYARGIKCNQWYAVGVEEQTVDGHKVTITSKRNHWFSTEDWSDANCVEGVHDANGDPWECATQIPVRIVSEGTVLNHTSGKTEKFHDHYEYVGFIIGKSPDYMYDATGVCSDAIAKQPEKNENAKNQNLRSGGGSSSSSGAVGSDLSSDVSKKSGAAGVKKRSAGANAGVVVGALAGIIAVIAVVVVVLKKGRNSRSNMALNGGGWQSTIRGRSGATRLVDDDEAPRGANCKISVPVVQSGYLDSTFAVGADTNLNAANLCAV